jgi:ABC-type phosphate/phosphonate transport system substrate-binding protein
MKPFEAGWWVLLALAPLAGWAQTPADSSRFRLAVSEKVVGSEVNGADARNAMKAWADSISRQSGITFEYDRAILSTTEELVQAIRNRLVDGFAISTPEYMQVASLVDPAALILSDRNAGGGEEFLLLVQADSPIRTLADLRGRTLMVPDNIRAILAVPWIETLLATSRLGPAKEFFGRLTTKPKLSQVVLPVYFRQADVCVANRDGFDVLKELNPQLAQKLRVLATSPKLVNQMVAFHADCPPPRKARFCSAMLSLHQTPSGQQALTLFQSRRLELRDSSVLRGTVELLKAYERTQGGKK